MSSGAQLDAWARRNIQPPNEWLGIFMSDQLDQARHAVQSSNSPLCSLIFNYDPSAKGGSHWVGVRVHRNHSGHLAGSFWFDSYGRRPDADDEILGDDTHFKKFLHDVSPSGEVHTSHLDLQALDTKVCGQYALLFCWQGMPSKHSGLWRQVLNAAPQPKSFRASQDPLDQNAARLRDKKVAGLIRL